MKNPLALDRRSAAIAGSVPAPPGVRSLLRRQACLLALVLATALALAPPAAATEQTPPVALGGSSLSLSLSLWKQAAPGSSWTSQSTGSVTTTELAGGKYVFGALPTATGTERYALYVALAAAPDAALYSTIWGAVPGTRIVWRQELEPPAQPLVFKRGDTFGAISLHVLRRLPAEACSATVTFAAWSVGTGAEAWSGRAATVSDCTLDSTTGTYGATFTYDLASGDTATVGRYLGEFKLCYSPSSCHTLPADNRLEWKVVDRF
jgi:hypothetical protein